MKSFLKLLVLVPLALAAVAFAVANRQGVTVSFDPFATDIPAFALSGPLFVVIILTVVVGVVLGGVATWFGQGRHRRGMRALRRENESLRAEAARLRADRDEAAARREQPPAYPSLPGQYAA